MASRKHSRNTRFASSLSDVSDYPLEYYVDGNTVRQEEYVLDDEPRRKQPVRRKRRRTSPKIRQNRAAKSAVTRGYFVLLGVCTAFLLGICVNMLRIQFNIFQHRGNIRTIQNQTAELRTLNEGKLSELSEYTDINRVRQIAVEDYGMVYASAAKTTEIAQVNPAESEYVVQNEDIPTRY